MNIEFERGTAYTVDRGAPKLRGGQGMLTGLGVALRHFRNALTRRLDDPSEISGLYTVQYPEEREPLPEASRNLPILLYEDATGQELCTSCFQCERICPPQVIHITQAKDPATGKAIPAVAEFQIEYDACMSCGLCAEVCPFDAIKMDHEFELSLAQRDQLTIDRAGLLRPISYYEQLAPTFWAEVRDGALKKLQGAARRRPGLIGIAPQMADTVAAERARSASTVTPEQNDRPAPIGAAPSAAVPEQPTGVREHAPQPAAESPAEPAPMDPAAAKAAKLAAIRAANARKGDAQAALEVPAPTEPSKGGSQAAPTEAASMDPAADKAARLAAIRAANARKKQES